MTDICHALILKAEEAEEAEMPAPRRQVAELDAREHPGSAAPRG